MTSPVESLRVDAHGSLARCKDAEIALDTDISEIIIDTDEPDHQLEQLHDDVNKYGTVFNTLDPGTSISGVLRRKELHP